MFLKKQKVKNNLNQTVNGLKILSSVLSLYFFYLLIQTNSEQLFFFFNSLYINISENIFFLFFEQLFLINLQESCTFSSLFIEEYFGIFIFFIIATVIALIIAIASYSLTNQVPELEKLSPYECGFETYEAPRIKFDIKFCVIAILLIIFDVEIMYLFPWCISVAKISMLGTWSMIDFIIELTFGYVYVLEKNALEW